MEENVLDERALFQEAFSDLESLDESEKDFELIEEIFKNKKVKNSTDESIDPPPPVFARRCTRNRNVKYSRTRYTRYSNG